MITVLYVETGSGYGGSAQSLLQLLSAIDRSRVRPIVVAYHEGSAIRSIRALGVPVHLLSGPVSRGESYGRLIAGWFLHELPRTLWLLRFIRRERVDLVHLNTFLYAAVAGLWAAKLTRRLVVCHLRLSRRPTRSERVFGHWVDQFVVLTNYAKQFYHGFWPRQRLNVIYNAVGEITDPVACNNNRIRQEVGVDVATPFIGLLARCVPGKGYEEFIQAAAIVRHRYPDARFLIAGNGAGGDDAHEQAMRNLAKALGLDGSLIWYGWRDDVPRILRSLDIVTQVSSTFPEGFGRVAAEAMACGTAVVATALPALAEVVGGDQTGVLVPPANAEALASALISLLEHPDLRKQIAEEGQRRARELFSPDAHARAIERVYDEVMGGPGSRTAASPKGLR